MEEAGTMNSDKIKLHEFCDTASLVEAFAHEIASKLEKAIETQGSATLIVSGGSTPKPLFELLKTVDLAWEKVKVGLCDERWVEPSHKDSNERFIKETLLQDKASKATFIPMFVEGEDASVAEEICSKNVEKELMPFDVLILGMGGDAHTASLFPNNEKLEQGLSKEYAKHCICMTPDTAPHTRMSLSANAILSAKNLYLHFEGEEKRAVFEKALKSDDIKNMPIAAFLQQKEKDIEVYYR